MDSNGGDMNRGESAKRAAIVFRVRCGRVTRNAPRTDAGLFATFCHLWGDRGLTLDRKEEAKHSFISL